MIGRNIARLVREGYDRDQAVAIAYRQAGRSNHAEVKAPGTPVAGIPLAKLPGIAVFSAGFWNGRRWTPELLRQMRDNYLSLAKPGPNGRPWYVPYVSINHDKFPEMKGFRFGSLENVRLDGNTIRFDADGVPEPVARLVKSGMLAHPSAEIVEPMRDASGKIVSGFAGPDGKIIDGPVIKCLTLLGNDVPGVKGSDPLPDPVYSSRSPLPVAAFAFVGGVLSRFASLPMDRQAILTALQALNVDTSWVTDDIPDEALQKLLASVQAAVTASQNPNPNGNNNPNGNGNPPVLPQTSMADVNANPPSVPAVQVPAVSGTSPNGTPSQLVVKFADGSVLNVTQLVNTANAAMAQATAAAGVASRTVAADRERVIAAFFADTDIDKSAQVTPDMRPALRVLLDKCDHVKTRKFSDANLAKFHAGGLGSGTELEETIAHLKASLPAQAKVGRQTELGRPGTHGAGQSPGEIDPERLRRVLSGSPQGKEAIKRLGAAKK